MIAYKNEKGKKFMYMDNTPTNHPLASAWVPEQAFIKLYDKTTALNRGTIFEQLDLPFEGESVARGGCRHG